MLNTGFHYTIVGAGCAGLQLAMALAEKTQATNKKIALIDKRRPSKNDKTWSFWEAGAGKWDSILSSSYSYAFFKAPNTELKLKLNPYTYKSLKAADFYTYSFEKLKAYAHVIFIEEEVVRIQENRKEAIVTTALGSYRCSHVFDSRIPAAFYNQNRYLKIQQHFKGIRVKTKNPVFNTQAFTMMDYRFSYPDSTSFMYVLPYSPNEALIEFTFFSPFTVKESVYDQYNKNYLKNYLNTTDFEILETETGNIPMSNYPFHKHHTNRITKIGTGGGWVKPSSGYSFKNTEKKVKQIIKNIEEDRLTSYGLYSKKYNFYDTIFLKVLQDNNHLGPWLFTKFYSKNSVPTMFRFLDEESRFKEEFKIMRSLFSWAFIKAFFQTRF
ncbi:lycopene cyclase family protein [Mesonia sp. HuA40]|uniref:lycopene cyclase family protein n=1 Tax=Mesonia sp. HuA40 TaxID=2602761 RepID=UPI0011CBF5C9|nr:lycopene cyclase family protein [Mesonia sp. HuA40]TXK72315.1 lycopene cyclase [Mesonia sp. HuA40]